MFSSFVVACADGKIIPKTYSKSLCHRSKHNLNQKDECRKARNFACKKSREKLVSARQGLHKSNFKRIGAKAGRQGALKKRDRGGWIPDKSHVTIPSNLLTE